MIVVTNIKKLLKIWSGKLMCMHCIVNTVCYKHFVLQTVTYMILLLCMLHALHYLHCTLATMEYVCVLALYTVCYQDMNSAHL